MPKSKPSDPKFHAILVAAIEQAEHEQRTAAAGVPNLTILWGYVWPDGSHDIGACSPPSNLTSNQQASIIESQYNAILTAGGSPAQWVDGYPPNVVQAVATYLNVPVGQPAGWMDPPATGG